MAMKQSPTWITPFAIGCLLMGCASERAWTITETFDPCRAYQDSMRIGTSYRNAEFAFDFELDPDVEFIHKGGTNANFTVHELIDGGIWLEVNGEVIEVRDSRDSTPTYGRYVAHVPFGDPPVWLPEIDWKLFTTAPGFGDDPTEQAVSDTCNPDPSLLLETTSGMPLVLSKFGTGRDIRVINLSPLDLTLSDIRMTRDPDDEFTQEGPEVFTISPSDPTQTIAVGTFMDFRINVSPSIPGVAGGVFTAKTSNSDFSEIEVPVIVAPS